MGVILLGEDCAREKGACAQQISGPKWGEHWAAVKLSRLEPAGSMVKKLG